MSKKSATLKAELLRLSEAERWEMLGALYESLPWQEGVMNEDDPGLLAELDRRRLEHESGLDPGIPAEELFRSLRENRT
ncbi:MAG TPA: hypothetical protein VGI99_03390 [Gemmataceae bacterium]|jgi:putative addiction module component (TIGR02574 family)